MLCMLCCVIHHEKENRVSHAISYGYVRTLGRIGRSVLRGDTGNRLSLLESVGVSRWEESRLLSRLERDLQKMERS